MAIKFIIGGLGLSGKIFPRGLYWVDRRIFIFQPTLAICTLELGADLSLRSEMQGVGMMFIFESTQGVCLGDWVIGWSADGCRYSRICEDAKDYFFIRSAACNPKTWD
jgi:hypothetical protein